MMANEVWVQRMKIVNEVPTIWGGRSSFQNIRRIEDISKKISEEIAEEGHHVFPWLIKVYRTEEGAQQDDDCLEQDIRVEDVPTTYFAVIPDRDQSYWKIDEIIELFSSFTLWSKVNGGGSASISTNNNYNSSGMDLFARRADFELQPVQFFKPGVKGYIAQGNQQSTEQVVRRIRENPTVHDPVRKSVRNRSVLQGEPSREQSLIQPNLTIWYKTEHGKVLHSRLGCFGAFEKYISTYDSSLKLCKYCCSHLKNKQI